MKIGLIFESVLKRGLLEFASTLPNGAPEFRYAYHEVIEEAQHSLMFQEFINRTDLTAAVCDTAVRDVAALIVTEISRRAAAILLPFLLPRTMAPALARVAIVQSSLEAIPMAVPPARRPRTARTR